MEARIARFRDLAGNPWFSMMNWVLDEMTMPPKNRRVIQKCWMFYAIPKEIRKNGFEHRYGW
jgi:hypothetical protein